MSLICNECEIDMKPSDDLPGRERGMVYPKVKTSIWTPDSINLEWIDTIARLPNNRSLCFACITQKVSKYNKSLQIIFDAYKAEV